MKDKVSQQQIEKYYFEAFSKCYSLPEGIPEFDDKPDVVICGSRRVGVEISNFYIADGNDTSSEQVQSLWREEVISEAQKHFLGRTNRHVELSFDFDKTKPIRDKSIVARAISDRACSIDLKESGLVHREAFEGVEEISSVYFNANEYSDARWRLTQVHATPVLSRERVLEYVRRKEEDSRFYKKCDALWLLLVVDFINRAQDQEILVSDFTRVESPVFEKIIVFKTCFEHILEAK